MDQYALLRRPVEPERRRSPPGEPAPARAETRAVHALQRTAGNKATARLLQRWIHHKPGVHGKPGTYGYNKGRSPWRRSTEIAMLAEYNARSGQALPSLPYKQLKMARAHEGSYRAIQSRIAKFLNDPADGPAFETFVRQLTSSLDPNSDECLRIIDAHDALRNVVRLNILGPGLEHDIVKSANALLSLLNNLTKNLRAADKYLNSYIQERLDLVFIQTSPGVYSLSAHGKRLLEMGVDVWGALQRTPERGERVVSSHGAVPIGQMSPDTRPRVEQYPFVQVPIGSAQVEDRLYGPNQLGDFPKAFAASAQPVLAPPPPTYQLIGLVHRFGDGTEVHRAYDNQAQSITHLLFRGSQVLKDLGATWFPPPPRYQFVSRAQFHPDGTEVHLAKDSVTGGLTWLWVRGMQVLSDLGPGWAPLP
jgi:hypothetical protein